MNQGARCFCHHRTEYTHSVATHWNQTKNTLNTQRIECKKSRIKFMFTTGCEIPWARVRYTQYTRTMRLMCKHLNVQTHTRPFACTTVWVWVWTHTYRCGIIQEHKMCGRQNKWKRKELCTNQADLKSVNLGIKANTRTSYSASHKWMPNSNCFATWTPSTEFKEFNPFPGSLKFTIRFKISSQFNFNKKWHFLAKIHSNLWLMLYSVHGLMFKQPVYSTAGE